MISSSEIGGHAAKTIIELKPKSPNPRMEAIIGGSIQGHLNLCRQEMPGLESTQTGTLCTSGVKSERVGRDTEHMLEIRVVNADHCAEISTTYFAMSRRSQSCP